MSAPQQPLPTKSRGIFSRRDLGMDHYQDVEQSPFMEMPIRDVSPERSQTDQPRQHVYYAPYNTDKNMPGQAYTRDQNTEYKQVQDTAYPVSSSHETSTEITKRPFYLPTKKPSFGQRHKGWFELFHGFLIFVVVGALLSIPIIITADSRESHDDDSDVRQTKNLVYYIFLVLLTTWGISSVFYLIAVALPYIFYAVAHFINPAHKKYWRVFVMMRRPITFLFAVIGGYIAVTIWFWENDQLSGYNNAKGDTQDDVDLNQAQYASTILVAATILLYFILWAGAYFLEKVFITYLTIHYHYRANHYDIQRSKKMVEVLIDLYEYSTMLFPRGHTMFAVEDHVIHAAHDAEDGKHHFGSSVAGFMDKISGNFVQAFGIVFGGDSTTHWLSPRSNYTIVTKALEHPASSAALAKRIWMSLASESRDVVVFEDILAVYGPKRQKTAVEYFKVLDENENGDIRLDEMVPTIVEAGQKRNNIYAGMANMTHVINTLDWICVGWLATIMGGLVLISQIDLLKSIKEVIGFAALGLSFVVGRTFNEVVQGAIFTILDHPYDIGDVVELYTLAENNKVLATVKRISLLYTVFTEVGSGKQVQYTNMRSKIKRISNLTRSGKNREAITFGCDFETSFTDIQLLRQEINEFITAPENSRDYYPEFALRVTSLCDLNRLELRVSFLHKSNWSNDALRAMRSSRFHCAVVAAVRRVPINKPGGASTGLGNEGKPSYTVMITDTEAATKRAADKEKQSAKRMDYVKAEPVDDKLETAFMSEEQLARHQEAEAARKKEEADAVEADKLEKETQARVAMMGIKTLTHRNNAATSGFDMVGEDGRHRFAFVTGEERGVRQHSSSH